MNDEFTPQTTICKKCNFLDGCTIQCTSEAAPVTDFVTGFKDPKLINKDGHCLHYKPKGDEQ